MGGIGDSLEYRHTAFRGPVFPSLEHEARFHRRKELSSREFLNYDHFEKIRDLLHGRFSIRKKRKGRLSPSSISINHRMPYHCPIFGDLEAALLRDFNAVDSDQKERERERGYLKRVSNRVLCPCVSVN